MVFRKRRGLSEEARAASPADARPAKRTGETSAGKGKQKKDGRGVNDKADDSAGNTAGDQGEYLTTNQGVRVNDDQNTLKRGGRGASLLEDFIFREKITHFDHERIPERVVHARGAGAEASMKVVLQKIYWPQ